MVDRDQQRRLPDGVDTLGQRFQLFRGLVVAGKQDHAADQGVPQSPDVIGVEFGTLDIDHDGA